MFKSLIISASLFLATSAFATPISFGVNFESGYVDGVGQIKIMQAKEGKLWVQWDKNVCNSRGTCTSMAFGGETIEPTVINDARGSDGDLLLQLTSEIQLSVSAGFTPDHSTDYTAIVTKDDGKTAKVPLKVSVYTTIPN